MNIDGCRVPSHPRRLCQCLLNRRRVAQFPRTVNLGGVVERLMAPVLKTGRAQALVGSNPTPSATQLRIADCGLRIWSCIQRATKYAQATPSNDAQTTSERKCAAT